MEGLSGGASGIIAVIQLTEMVIKYAKDVKDGADGLNMRSRLGREAANLLGVLTNLCNLIDFCNADTVQYRTIKELGCPNGPLEQYKDICKRLYHKLRPVDKFEKVLQVFTWNLDKEEITALLLQIERLKSSVQLAIEMDSLKITSAIKADTNSMKNVVQLLQGDVHVVKTSTGDVKDELQLVKRGVGIANTGINRVGKSIGFLQSDVGCVKDGLGTAVDEVFALKASIKDDAQARQSKELLDRICSTDYADEHFDHLQRHESGTGEWFLKHPKFTAWQNATTVEDRTLLCPGDPGTGKTMLAALSVKHLRTTLNATMAPVLHIYCDYKRQEQQTGLHMISSLLRQLLAFEQTIPEQIESLYRETSWPTFHAVQNMLRLAMHNYTKLFIVLDALDECGDEARKKLLMSLSGLRESDCVHILATTRHAVPGVDSFFVNNTRLEIAASKDDIERYVRVRLSDFSESVQDNPELQNQIVTAVLQATDGIFLIAKLQMNSLESKETLRQLKTALRSLRKDVNAYETAYTATMERINNQSTERRKYATTILCWLVFAEKQLEFDAIQHALAVAPGDEVFDVDNTLSASQILSFCAGLVVIEHQTKIIRLVHFTTQEYLISTQLEWLPEAEKYLTRICWAYLSLSNWKPKKATNAKGYVDIHRNYSLASYAADHWQNHFVKARKDGASGFLGEEYFSEAVFLQSGESVDSVCRLMARRPFPLGQCREPNNDITAVHLLAHLGLIEMLKFWVKDRDENTWLNKRCSFGATPLQQAACQGHGEIVDWLLSKQHIEPDAKNVYGSTPLSIACECQHSSVVASLLATGNVDVNVRDTYGETPLLSAIIARHFDIAKLLMTSDDVDADVRNCKGTSTLYAASEAGDADMVDLLLTRTLKTIDSLSSPWGLLGDIHRTALGAAASSGDTSVVRRLLAAGADVERGGRSPLSWASERWHVDVMKLLLEQGAEVNAKDEFGLVPLQYAIKTDLDPEMPEGGSENDEGQREAIDLLIQHGTDISVLHEMDEVGLVHEALVWGSTVTLEAILQTVTLTAIAKGRFSFQAMQCVHQHSSRHTMAHFEWVFEQHLQVPSKIKVLLAAGAMVDARDDQGRTPLLCAAEGYCAFQHQGDILLLLLAHGAKLEAENLHGVSTLKYFEERLKTRGSLSRRKSLVYNMLQRWKTREKLTTFASLTPADEVIYGRNAWRDLSDSDSSEQDSTDDFDDSDHSNIDSEDGNYQSVEEETRDEGTADEEESVDGNVAQNNVHLVELPNLLQTKRQNSSSSLPLVKKRQRSGN